jgi:hypothetical protein
MGLSPSKTDEMQFYVPEFPRSSLLPPFTYSSISRSKAKLLLLEALQKLFN